MNGQTLYDGKCQKYGVTNESETFKSDYIWAVNSALTDLLTESWVSVDSIENTSDEIDCEDKYTMILSDGVDYYLQMLGRWSTSEKRDLYTIWFKQRLPQAQRLYLIDNPPTGILGEL